MGSRYRSDDIVRILAAVGPRVVTLGMDNLRTRSATVMSVAYSK